MESFYKKTTIAGPVFPDAFSTQFGLSETMFNLHYQIVLHVADEANLIEENWRKPFYKYLASCVKICGGNVETIGGAPNCVHLLIALPSTKVLARFLRELKLLSQTWVRRRLQVPNFAWQNGGEAFTVSPTQRERVRAYIHHLSACYRQNSGNQKTSGQCS